MMQDSISNDSHYCEEPIICPYCCHNYETRWYLSFGRHHFRFHLGKVFGRWTFNVGLKFVDFGLAWDEKREALTERTE